MKKRNKFLDQVRKEIPNSTRVEVESKVERVIIENMTKEEYMNKFAENNPERLREFVSKLDELIDEYHANIYLIDGVYDGTNLIIDAIREKLGDYNGL